MIISIPKETIPGERRVALLPELVSRLTQSRMDVLVQQGAGAAAGFPESAYLEKGARLSRPTTHSTCRQRAGGKPGSKVRGAALETSDLYYNPKCMMLFGDAKDSLNKLFAALKL
jgi:NAD/NADP transhydrogenase alpha subunit